MRIFLTDNGSLRPASIFSLRRLARACSEKLGLQVEPASLLHANRVSAEALGGEKAMILEETLRRALSQGETEFYVIPLFFGPSRALTEYIPAVVKRLEDQYGSFSLRMARPFVDVDDPATVEVAGNILQKGINPILESVGVGKGLPGVILVDHGSPEIGVTQVRNALGQYLEDQLGSRTAKVIAASMERREEPEYSFNEPLLESALKMPELQGRPLIVSLLFFQPGRHAGQGGDIEEICDRARKVDPASEIHRTPLVGEFSETVDVLAERAGEALNSNGI